MVEWLCVFFWKYAFFAFSYIYSLLWRGCLQIVGKCKRINVRSLAYSYVRWQDKKLICKKNEIKAAEHVYLHREFSSRKIAYSPHINWDIIGRSNNNKKTHLSFKFDAFVSNLEFKCSTFSCCCFFDSIVAAFNFECA